MTAQSIVTGLTRDNVVWRNADAIVNPQNEDNNGVPIDGFPNAITIPLKGKYTQRGQARRYSSRA